LLIDWRLGPIEDIRQGRLHHRPEQTGSVSTVSPPWLLKQWLVGCVFAFSGAAAMVYEVGWFCLLGLTMGPLVYVFSAILGMFFLGVGLGSTVAAHWVERTRLGGVATMAVLEGLLCMVGLLQSFFFNRFPQLNYELFIWGTNSFRSNGLFLGQLC